MVAKRQFYKFFPVIISYNFPYQTFMAVSGNLGGNFSGVDDSLSNHEKEIHPTTLLDEDCREFETPKDQNCNVGFRQICWALKLKIAKVAVYEAFNSKQVLKKTQRRDKRGWSGCAKGERRSSFSGYSFKYFQC